MTLSLSESQAFLAKQAQLWQDQSSRLSDTSQDMQWLRDEEAQAVLQLEAEKVVALLQRQLELWTNAAKGHLVSLILTFVCRIMYVQCCQAFLTDLSVCLKEVAEQAAVTGNSAPTSEPKNFRDRYGRSADDDAILYALALSPCRGLS